MERTGILLDEVEDAFAEDLPTGPQSRRSRSVPRSEETIEDKLRVDLLRDRRRRRSPRDVRRVRATVTRVAISGLPAPLRCRVPATGTGWPCRASVRRPGRPTRPRGCRRRPSCSDAPRSGTWRAPARGRQDRHPDEKPFRWARPLRTINSSRNGLSGSRIFGRSKSAPSFDGRPVGHVDAVRDVEEGHSERRPTAPPPAARTTGASDSSQGSVRAVPRPRSTVRLEIR